MRFCPRCGFTADDDDHYCRKCGADLLSAPLVQVGSRGVSRKSFWLVAATMVLGLAAFGLIFVLSSKGCGRVNGSFVSSGSPYGDFQFVPTRCRSGERAGFYGVTLMQEEPEGGGIMVFGEPSRQKLVVQVPHSCGGSNAEQGQCKEFTISPEQCSRFNVLVSRTNITVNDIRLLDGQVVLDCKFPEGGTAMAGIHFENCD